MLTCQLLMSTCQKIIITITSSIYWFYTVLMSLTSIYLSIWHLTYRHQFLISWYSFLTSRQNDLADKLTHLLKSRFSRQLCWLVRCYVNFSENDVDFSDLNVDLSYIMSTCQMILPVICIASVSYTHLTLPTICSV